MMFFEIIGFFVFLFGAAIGSFLNVLVYRSMRGQDWVNERSVCEKCKKKIPWYENIPIFSYLFLRGRCSGCQTKIDKIHPLVETMTGILFLWWYFAGYIFFKISSAPLLYVQPIFWLFISIIFIVIFLVDLKYYVIPNWTISFLTFGTLVYRFLLLFSGEMRWIDFGWSLVWTVCFFGFFFGLKLIASWLAKKEAFGDGDVLLAIPLGLILGSWQRILVALFFSFVIGAIVGVILIISNKKTIKSNLPFGPFLIISTLISLVWGYKILAEYVKIVLR
ncbi:prepilin peptidase [Candidatus Pacearchaeota archaeon]|nr:prepilin peptidase [Candidatus Pacearchaeota archaeon]